MQLLHYKQYHIERWVVKRQSRKKPRSLDCALPGPLTCARSRSCSAPDDNPGVVVRRPPHFPNSERNPFFPFDGGADWVKWTLALTGMRRTPALRQNIAAWWDNPREFSAVRGCLPATLAGICLARNAARGWLLEESDMAKKHLLIVSGVLIALGYYLRANALEVAANLLGARIFFGMPLDNSDSAKVVTVALVGFGMLLTGLVVGILGIVGLLKSSKPGRSQGRADQRFCTQCGAANAAGDLFCRECGVKFA